MMKLTFITTTGIACATILALTFAALSATHWIIALDGQPTPVIALAVIGSVCVSLLGPACAFLMRSYGWLLIVPALTFISADCYQNALGYQTVTSLTASVEVEAAQARLDAARLELSSLPLPNASGAIRQASTWETLNTTLQGRVEAAQSELTALQVPSVQTERILAVMAIIQIALSIVFACLGKPNQAKPVAAPAAQPVPVANVVPIRKPMDASSQKAWNAISKTA